MKPSHTIRIRLERYAWMVALVVVLRLAAWDLHHVLDQHDYEAKVQCDFCLVIERGGDAVVASAGNPPALCPSPTPRGPLADPLRPATAPCPLPRGPPSFPG